MTEILETVHDDAAADDDRAMTVPRHFLRKKLI